MCLFRCCGLQIGPNICFKEQIPDKQKMQLPTPAKVLLVVLGILAIIAGITALAGVPEIATLGLPGGLSLIVAGAVLLFLGGVPIKILLKDPKKKFEESQAPIVQNWLKSSYNNRYPVMTDFLTKPEFSPKEAANIEFLELHLDPLTDNNDREFINALHKAYPLGIQQIRERYKEDQRELVFSLTSKLYVMSDQMNRITEVGYNQNKPEIISIIKACVLYVYERRGSSSKHKSTE